MGAVVLGEIETACAENRSGAVSLRIGPQFVPGGQHEQVGRMVDPVDGSDAGSGDPLDRRGDQVCRRIVQCREKPAGDDETFGENA